MEQHYRNQTILKWIIQAKAFYLRDRLGRGMCKAFNKVANQDLGLKEALIGLLKSQEYGLLIYEGEVMYQSEWLRELIPEFRFDTLGGDTNTSAYRHLQEKVDISIWEIYWWERDDKESRIKAFDKLIKIYEAKVNG